MSIISDSLQVIQANIATAAARAQRNDSVTLLAVSKAQVAEKLREAYQAGQHAFGESYVQEAISKQTLLEDCNIEWHFIGPIQSNKTQLIAQHFSWVHSVDRLKVADRLAKARAEYTNQPLNICMQVNSSNEASKSGVTTAETADLASAITALPSLKLRGIMAIPAPTTDLVQQRAQFRQVRQVYESLKQQGHRLDTLSIGMSNDYQAAIEEGATIVRIGSAIFGKREGSK